MTDKIKEAFNSFWLGEEGEVEDISSPDIQEAFAATTNPEWSYDDYTPDKTYVVEQERQRRERLLGLAFCHWNAVGTKGVVDIASAMEEYVNG